jgi:hypothetical protein
MADDTPVREAGVEGSSTPGRLSDWPSASSRVVLAALLVAFALSRTALATVRALQLRFQPGEDGSLRGAIAAHGLTARATPLGVESILRQQLEAP